MKEVLLQAFVGAFNEELPPGFEVVTPSHVISDLELTIDELVAVFDNVEAALGIEINETGIPPGVTLQDWVDSLD